LKKIIRDEKTNTIIFGEFDKVFKNKEYEILFNTKSGFEVLRGINGYDDPFVTDLPTMMDIGIMGSCRNHCSFCYQGDKKEPNMTLDDFKQIIDEVKYHASQCALGGRGNPEDHENFEEIIKYARENNVVPNFTTAGNNVTDKIVSLTKEYIGAVAVSNYNKPYTYRSLKMFMDARVKTNIHFIYSRQSHRQAMDLINGKDIWNGKVDIEKLNAVVFLLFKAKGRGKDKLYMVPSEYQVKEFGESINKTKLSIKIGMDSCLINRVQQYANFTPQQKISVDTCESGRMSVYVTPDMKLVPCSFADHDKYGLSIKDKSIKEVWTQGWGFNDFRNTLKETPNCCPAILE